jgi:hypothetical protein
MDELFFNAHNQLKNEFDLNKLEQIITEYTRTLMKRFAVETPFELVFWFYSKPSLKETIHKFLGNSAISQDIFECAMTESDDDLLEDAIILLLLVGETSQAKEIAIFKRMDSVIDILEGDSHDRSNNPNLQFLFDLYGISWSADFLNSLDQKLERVLGHEIPWFVYASVYFEFAPEKLKPSLLQRALSKQMHLEFVFSEEPFSLVESLKDLNFELLVHLVDLLFLHGLVDESFRNQYIDELIQRKIEVSSYKAALNYAYDSSMKQEILKKMGNSDRVYDLALKVEEFEFATNFAIEKFLESKNLDWISKIHSDRVRSKFIEDHAIEIFNILSNTSDYEEQNLSEELIDLLSLSRGDEKKNMEILLSGRCPEKLVDTILDKINKSSSKANIRQSKITESEALDLAAFLYERDNRETWIGDILVKSILSS